MLALLLGILKIVGVILLIVLGIVLLLILLVLLVPIRYQAEGAFDGTPAGFAKVTWLLHLISAKAEYREALDITVKVLGFRVFGMKLPEEPETDLKTKPDAEKSSEAGENVDEDAGAEDPKRSESGAGNKKKSEKKSGKKKEDREESGRAKTEGKTEGKIEIKKEAEAAGLEKITNRIRSAADAVREKIQAIRDKKEWAVAFLKNEDNQKTFFLLKRQVFRLIRHILPRKLSGRVKFGFDDPATTGQILTYISPFYGCYAGKLELVPVFEEKVMEGEVRLRGRIRILTVLWIAARMLFDRNFRKLIRWFLDR